MLKEGVNKACRVKKNFVFVFQQIKKGNLNFLKLPNLNRHGVNWMKDDQGKDERWPRGGRKTTKGR